MSGARPFVGQVSTCAALQFRFSSTAFLNSVKGIFSSGVSSSLRSHIRANQASELSDRCKDNGNLDSPARYVGWRAPLTCP